MTELLQQEQRTNWTDTAQQPQIHSEPQKRGSLLLTIILATLNQFL